MPAKRVLISVDERTLARIDDAARRDGLTRSRFLAEAAIARIDGGEAGASNEPLQPARPTDDTRQ